MIRARKPSSLCSTIWGMAMPRRGRRVKPRRGADQRERGRIACEIPGRRKDHVWACAIDSARPDRAPAMLEAERYELAAPLGGNSCRAAVA